jgi:lipoate-protein ligase B
MMPYDRALELQREIARARGSAGLMNDVLLLVEHPPVVTLGRSAARSAFPVARELLLARGAEVFEVERGGDVTFHGPGQLVGYPIMDLRAHRPDLHWYLRQLEEVMIRTVESFGVAGTRHAGLTGAWTSGPLQTPTSLGDERAVAAQQLYEAPVPTAPPAGEPLRKIASIGIHARDWITWHGFALNVNTDLSWFDLMVPCGIEGVRMTSIAAELGNQLVPMDQVHHCVATSFEAVFDVGAKWVPPHRLLVAA